MRNGRLWLAGFAILLLVVLGAAWSAGSQMVRPGSWPVADARPPARDVELAASDGVAIAATYRPGVAPDAPGVLLLHGNGGSRPIAFADWLAGQGYAVLAIDFRGHGESAPAQRSFGLHESRDAEAAFAWLKRRQQGARIAVIGISLGGAASLLGDKGPLPADALVLQAVYPDIRRAVRNRIAAVAGAPLAWLGEPLLSLQSLPRYGVWPGRIAPVAALRRYRGPVLVIGGGADRYTPPDETREFYAAATGPHVLWLMPGLDHRGVSGTASPAYREVVRRFLEKWIGKARVHRQPGIVLQD